MALKLAIADVIGLNCEGSYIDEKGETKPYKFVLFCERLSQDQMKGVLSDKEETIPQFFEKRARDWKDQRLVMETDAAGKDVPAPFSVDALKLLLSIGGMASACWDAYLSQVRVGPAKNS